MILVVRPRLRERTPHPLEVLAGPQDGQPVAALEHRPERTDPLEAQGNVRLADAQLVEEDRLLVEARQGMAEQEHHQEDAVGARGRIPEMSEGLPC